MTPVMAHGDSGPDCGVMDVYKRWTHVGEESRSRGQGHGRKERPYRTMAGNTSMPQQLPRHWCIGPEWELQKCNRGMPTVIASAASESCRSAIEGRTTMEEREMYPESSRSLESLREIRLLALLRDLVQTEGRLKTARMLGVNYRTLQSAAESGQLTERMAVALERLLLLGGGSAAVRQRERVDALERRVEGLAKEARAGFEEMRSDVGAEFKVLREEQAVTRRVLERRLVGLEARMKNGVAGTSTPGAEESEKPPGKPRYIPPRRLPQLVTREAEDGEEHVYGDAMPVILEWREAMAALHRASKTGSPLRRIDAHERLWELEIVLIGEHGLTLAPARYPWDARQRERQVWDRRDEIRHIRLQRKRVLRRRWLRRLLTLGFSWE